MKIGVIGAGVVGVTTAYYLWQEGYEVTVFEKNSAAGRETSDASACQLSYSDIYPFNTPSIFKMLPEVALGKADDLKIRAWYDPLFWAWSLRLLSHSFRKPSELTQHKLMELSAKSDKLMSAFLEKTALPFDYKRNGKLWVYDSAELEAYAEKRFADLQARGVKIEHLNAEQCFEKEPFLKHRATPVLGGLFFENDACGDCGSYCRNLADFLKNNGVTFKYETSIENIEAGVVLTTNSGVLNFDACVICSGLGTKSLMSLFGGRANIYPVGGVALSIDFKGLPAVNITDRSKRIVLANVNNKLRIAGTMRFEPFKTDKKAFAAERFKEMIKRTYPDVPLEQAEVYVGARPLTPNGTPDVRETRLKNVFVNSGHGIYGWTLAHVTSYQVAQMMKDTI